jgi:hypothetical protein
MAFITIVDESTGGGKHSWTLDVLDETLNARELIRRRVYQEVTEYNARQSGVFHGLVQPTGAERILNGNRTGYRLSGGRRLDWEAQYEKAVDAFSRRGYILLVDDRQVIELDAPVELHAGSEVTFLRLVPLVGG